jgi:precorrin isomerase
MEYLDKVNPITDKYKEMKHMMTLRQLYYQFVGQVVIGNENSAYRKLSRLLTDGRMASYVDWDAIGDRLRQPRLPY